MRWPLVVLLFLFCAHAQADLYRWVDPETGSVKFSSYPPPWYGDEGKQRSGPKVERIPSGHDPVARPDAAAGGAPDPARSYEALEAQRKALLQQMPGAAPRGAPERGVPALQKQLEALSTLSQQIDKLNPEGADKRRTEAEAVLQKLIKGLPR
jgi:uncharacterized protein DUF4124